MTRIININCPHCEKFHHLCKAVCCGVVPMDKKLVEENKDLITREILKTVPFDEDTEVLITEGMVCAFLDDNFRCKIYDKRPGVCKVFGDETDPLLTCPYQTSVGKGRYFKARKKLLMQTEERVSARMEILKDERSNLKFTK